MIASVSVLLVLPVRFKPKICSALKFDTTAYSLTRVPAKFCHCILAEAASSSERILVAVLSFFVKFQEDAASLSFFEIILLSSFKFSSRNFCVFHSIYLLSISF